MSDELTAKEIQDIVRARYASAARQVQVRSRASCCSGSDCCGSKPQLYTPGELQQVPEEAVLASLGCGNPTLLAELKPGEVVLDLGSGGGIDVLLSAKRVGPEGKAYGLDMTDEMLELARSNANAAGVTNVEFLKGQIESIPLPDASVDVIISNCVINLSADKDAVFAEAYRVLKPGGRFAVADVVVQGGELSPSVKQALALWAGCIAGALKSEEYCQKLAAAGFVDIDLQVLKVYTEEDIPEAEAAAVTADLKLDPGTRVVSAFVKAIKPPIDGGKRVKDYFKQVADRWDEMRKAYFTEEVREVAIARACLGPDSVVADVGTGTGFMLAGMAPLVQKAYGFDNSPEMLEVAKAHLKGLANVELMVSEGGALPMPASSLDAVFANMYLHHVPDPAAAIVELARVLKPGGRLIITDMDSHSHEWMRAEMADLWLGFERSQLERWIRDAGLTDVRVEHTGSSCCGTSCCGDRASISVFVASGVK